MRAASTLAKSYALYDTNEARLDIYQKIWSATHLERLDDKVFVTVLSNYVESLRVYKKHEIAKRELDSLLTKLSILDASLKTLSKRLWVIIKRAKLIKKTNNVKGAKSFLLERWKLFLPQLPEEARRRMELSRPLQGLAQALLEIKEFSLA